MNGIKHVEACNQAICNGETPSANNLRACLDYTEELHKQDHEKHCKIIDMEEEIKDLQTQLTEANKAVVKLVHKRI